MAKKVKPKKLPATCPDCGATQETVWMSNGKNVAVNPGKVEVIFCNMAMAGGRKLGAYTEHKCGKG